MTELGMVQGKGSHAFTEIGKTLEGLVQMCLKLDLVDVLCSWVGQGTWSCWAQPKAAA